MTEDTRRIEYRFLHWGPFVCNYILLPEEVAKLKQLEGGIDYRYHLAGHLENEKALDKDKVFNILNLILIDMLWDIKSTELSHYVMDLK